MNTIINILSKNPEHTDCKTRLKKLLSNEDRIFLTKHMLEMTCNALSGLSATKLLHLFPRKDGDFIESLAKRYDVSLKIQEAGKLSYKIYSILNQNIALYKKRLVIGSDIPSISSNEINKCILLLNKYDCVFGPSNDGGFYLVGVKGNAHFIFKNLEINTILLDDLVTICEKQRLSYTLINILKDIDCEKDLLFI